MSDLDPFDPCRTLTITPDGEVLSMLRELTQLTFTRLDLFTAADLAGLAAKVPLSDAPAFLERYPHKVSRMAVALAEEVERRLTLEDQKPEAPDQSLWNDNSGLASEECADGRA